MSPRLLNISGGRTSALMLRRLLDDCGGTLPADTHAVFANTGLECEETLAFLREISERWGVTIRWVERTIDRKFREVTFDTASRKGEPFTDLITQKSFLPNGVMRFCTQYLKIHTARDFMRSQGYEHWTSVVGLRYDEPDRVSRVRERDHEEWDVQCPLYDARITKAHVNDFWRGQPFDLRLKPWESNCAGCYLKSSSVLERIERDRPGSLQWWADQEARIGARFKGWRDYAALIRLSKAPRLPGVDFDDETNYSLPCACTD